MTQRTAAASSAGAAGAPPLRIDLQGVRGLGILLVVCGHFAQWPPGAFVALDMFFVLSGFFITGILIGGAARRGRIRFRSFYLARARRLVPVAALVIATTVAAHYLLVNEARGREVAQDGLWSALFWANWHFAGKSQDYFVTQASSPLVHFWSLGVEEQFYAAWPLWVSLAVALSFRAGWRPRVVFTWMFGLVALLGFAYSMWHSSAEPSVAYYSTFDRSWEFAAGALVATHRHLWAAIPPRWGRRMALLAIVGLTTSMVLVSPEVAFPAPWALPTVLMTCALLMSGENPDSKPLRLLTFVPLVYAGNISYSVYLWHLPTAAILGYFVDRGPLFYVSALGLTAALSVASYHLVEHPMRYAPWLMTARDRLRFERVVNNTRSQRRLGTIAVMGGATLTMIVAAITASSGPIGPSANAVVSADAPSAAVRGATGGQRDLLEGALRASTFPAFDPPLDELNLEAWGHDHANYGCTSVTSDVQERCLFGSGPLTAVVLGDSIAISWMPTIREALGPESWEVQQFTLPICGTWTLTRYWQSPVLEEDAVGEPEPYPECGQHHDEFRDYLAAVRPDLVFLASGAGQIALAGASGHADDARRFAEGAVTKTILSAQAVGAEVVLLSPPPTGVALERCVTRFSGPQDCVTEPDESWFAHTDGESTAARLNNATYVDTLDWFCVRGECPAFVGNTPVLADGGHMTRRYATSLAPLLRKELRGLLRRVERASAG